MEGAALRWRRKSGSGKEALRAAMDSFNRMGNFTSFRKSREFGLEGSAVKLRNGVWCELRDRMCVVESVEVVGLVELKGAGAPKTAEVGEVFRA